MKKHVFNDFPLFSSIYFAQVFLFVHEYVQRLQILRLYEDIMEVLNFALKPL